MFITKNIDFFVQGNLSKHRTDFDKRCINKMVSISGMLQTINEPHSLIYQKQLLTLVYWYTYTYI